MRSLDTIAREIESVIEYSQEYSFKTHANEIVKEWYNNKKFYIDLFDGETSICIDRGVIIHLTNEQKEDKFKEMMEELKDYLDSLASNNLSLLDFLMENKNTFFENRVSVEHRDLKIAKGMKILKCFKFFLSFSRCRAAQDIASRYIQNDKIEGDLYLSVDPLDFLTISESNSHWRSCHSLDGEYRAGNMSYMLDDTTLVSYLATKDKTQLVCFPEGFLWNNKIWRMLIHTNKFSTVCYYNRQYPFDNEELLHWVAVKVNSLSGGKLFPPEVMGVKQIIRGKELHDLDYNYILGERDRLYDTRDIFDDSELLGYLDLMYSPYYTPVVSMLDQSKSEYEYTVYTSDDRSKWDDAFHNEFDITIGKACKCLKCGDSYIERKDSFLCDYCIADEDLDEDRYLQCDCCGRRIYNADTDGYWVDGELLCKTCYDATLT